MGGGYAIALAAGHGFDASSVNYGGCPADAQDWLQDACPIVGSYGWADRTPMGGQSGKRLGEILFIDGRALGAMIPGSFESTQITLSDGTANKKTFMCKDEPFSSHRACLDGFRAEYFPGK